MNKEKKIFLVMNTGYFGDVLLTSKLTRDIKKEYPDSYLVFVSDTPYEDAAKGLPGVDEVICYDRKKCQHLFHLIKFIIKFPYKNKIDFTFIPNGRKTNRVFLAKVLGSKKSFILSEFQQTADCDKFASQKPLLNRFAYQVANMLSYLTQKATDDKDIEYNVPKSADEKMDKYFEGLNIQNDLIAINPQAGDNWKCWNVDEMVKFVKLVMKDGKKVVLTGILKDGTNYTEAMDEQIGAENYLNLMDKTPIPELGALYKRCQAVVSVDTGSMHMSCAVGTPTIALFFRDNYNYWGPLNNTKNSYLYNPEGISAEAVYDEIQRVTNLSLC